MPIKPGKDKEKNKIIRPEKGKKKSELVPTIDLVKTAVALLTDQQAHLPPEQRQFSASSIIKEVKKLRPDWDLHPSTLGRNREVREFLAEVRGEQLLTPDLMRFGGWVARESKGDDKRRRTRRRATLISCPVAELAEHVVGLEELSKHCDERRQKLEIKEIKGFDLMTTPWPDDRPYPMTPFLPSEGAARRFEHLRTRGTRPDLARHALRLEKQIAEHQEHLLRLDHAHMVRMLENAKRAQAVAAAPADNVAQVSVPPDRSESKY